jgi:hypothetical protein
LGVEEVEKVKGVEARRRISSSTHPVTLCCPKTGPLEGAGLEGGGGVVEHSG